MKLDKAQIKQVKDFVSSRGFTYYDVQLEIIDHVACKVEELMTADPSLTLDTAITQTHAGFGVMGFSVVEDAMRASLQKRYFNLFWATFLSYFKPVYLPIIAAGIYLVSRFAKATLSPDTLVLFAWAATFLLMGGYLLANYWPMRKYRRMLTMQMGGIAIILINVPMQIFTWLPHMANIMNADIMGIIPGVLLVVIIVALLALHRIQNLALDNCRELDEHYQLTIGS